MEKSESVENFLGICLGGKRCKERRAARQENRKEKRKAKTTSLKEDAEFKRVSNLLIASSVEPQQQITQQQQILPRQQIAELNAMPPVPQNQPQNNTLLWVGGGIGTLIILGLIAFLVLKK